MENTGLELNGPKTQAWKFAGMESPNLLALMKHLQNVTADNMSDIGIRIRRPKKKRNILVQNEACIQGGIQRVCQLKTRSTIEFGVRQSGQPLSIAESVSTVAAEPRVAARHQSDA